MEKSLEDVNKEINNQKLRLKDIKAKYANIFIDEDLFRTNNLDEIFNIAQNKYNEYQDKYIKIDTLSRMFDANAFTSIIHLIISLITLLLIANYFKINLIVKILIVYTIFTSISSVIYKTLEFINTRKANIINNKSVYYKNVLNSCSLEKELLLSREEIKEDNKEENIIDDEFNYDLVKDSLFIDEEKTYIRKRNKK